MTRTQLTLKSIRARPVVVPLKRPVVSKVGLFKDWPLILIDLYTNEGVVGHSYLEPYLKQSMRYIVPALEDLAEAAKNQPLAPFDSYRRAIGSLHLVGREGISLIATSGLDMAAWDALAKAADMPLAVFLGGTLGPVPAYNSNGLWLTPLDKLSSEAAALVAEGGFTDAKDFPAMIIDRFDQTPDRSPWKPVLMAIARHPYLVAPPYRWRHLRRAPHRVARARDRSLDRVTMPGEIVQHMGGLP